MAEIDVDQFLDVLSEGLTLQEDGVYLGDDAGLLIRERDTAIREAAKLEGKRELLAELHESAERWRQTALVGSQYSAAFVELRAKYQSADSQPAQDGERR